MIALNVNGVVHEVNVSSNDTPLLWVLRDILGMTGTKYGCGIEVCGACTVLIDGEPERCCQVGVGEAQGRMITTVEGLSADGKSHPLQQAWIQLQVPQCGYCQSGMLMCAAALLQNNPQPADSDIDEISNVCVCGTYQRIRAAIKLAATL
ncbi:MAG TPA: (2Fe-2S)-binding protein [Acidobacteriaceae bacterium]